MLVSKMGDGIRVAEQILKQNTVSEGKEISIKKLCIQNKYVSVNWIRRSRSDLSKLTYIHPGKYTFILSKIRDDRCFLLLSRKKKMKTVRLFLLHITSKYSFSTNMKWNSRNFRSIFSYIFFKCENFLFYDDGYSRSLQYTFAVFGTNAFMIWEI